MLFLADAHSAAIAQDSHGHDLFQEIAPKTVRLHVVGMPDGATAVDQYGTGFFTDGNHIVTAAHIFGETDWQFYIDSRMNRPTIDMDQPNANGLLIPFPNQNSGARLVRQDRTLDLALIQVSGNSPAVMCVDEDLARLEGRPYRALGWRPHRSGYDALVQPSEADVRLAPPEDGDQRWRFTAMEAFAGNSGGPIFNSKGQVIAVITSGRDKRLVPGQSETFATPIGALKSAFLGYNLDNCFKSGKATEALLAGPAKETMVSFEYNDELGKVIMRKQPDGNWLRWANHLRGPTVYFTEGRSNFHGCNGTIVKIDSASRLPDAWPGWKAVDPVLLIPPRLFIPDADCGRMYIGLPDNGNNGKEIAIGNVVTR